MKKLIKNKKLIVIVAIILIAVILAIVITTNLTNNKELASAGYFATTANVSSNLVASYIKSGITIGGITGTLEILDTSDANATSEDILEGKTAYVNGEKITGTLSTTEGNMTGVTRETVSLKTEGTYTFSADHKAVFIRAHYTGYDGSSLSTTTINGDFTIQGQENHWVNASFGTWGYAHVLIYGINPKSGNQIKFKLNGTTNSNLTLDIFFYD